MLDDDSRGARAACSGSVRLKPLARLVPEHRFKAAGFLEPQFLPPLRTIGAHMPHRPPVSTRSALHRSRRSGRTWRHPSESRFELLDGPRSVPLVHCRAEDRVAVSANVDKTIDEPRNDAGT